MCLGHKKAVRHLSVSLDGTTLVSGSDDNDVKLWHIASRQCCRTLSHKGEITATEYAIPPLPGCIDATDVERFRHSLILAPFEKTVFTREHKNYSDEDEYTFQTIGRERTNSDNTLTDEFFEMYDSKKKTFTADNILTESSHTTDNLASENDKLREINLELYQYAVSGILGDPINETKS